MNALKRKLNSNSGASMMLALAMLLVCVMVSSVVVSRAASGSSRVAMRLNKQQDYLAVSSAAQYIANNLNPEGNDQFVGAYCSGVKPCTKYQNYGITSGIEWNGELVDAYRIPMPKEMVAELADSDIDLEGFYLLKGEQTAEQIFCKPVPTVEVDAENTSFTGPFAELMQKAASEVYLHNVAYEYTFTICVEDERIPDVVCDFMMDTNYNVWITLYSDRGTSEYTMTVSMAKKQIKDGMKDPQEVKCSKDHTYFYQFCDSNGNIKTSETIVGKFAHDVETHTKEITWGTPEIAKGGN